MRQLNFDLKTLQARRREDAFITRRDRAYALGFRRLRATGVGGYSVSLTNRNTHAVRVDSGE